MASRASGCWQLPGAPGGQHPGEHRVLASSGEKLIQPRGQAGLASKCRVCWRADHEARRTGKPARVSCPRLAPFPPAYGTSAMLRSENARTGVTWDGPKGCERSVMLMRLRLGSGRRPAIGAGRPLLYLVGADGRRCRTHTADAPAGDPAGASVRGVRRRARSRGWGGRARAGPQLRFDGHARHQDRPART